MHSMIVIGFACILANFIYHAAAQNPSSLPSSLPLSLPSSLPSSQPSKQPSQQPTCHPTSKPLSSQPSRLPTSQPSIRPSSQPFTQPTTQPTFQPSRQPSEQPVTNPSSLPSCQPSTQPSRRPTSQPSHQPSRQPSQQPSQQPTRQPSSRPIGPSVEPTMQPSVQPSSHPSNRPTSQPYNEPSGQPSGNPSFLPSSQPSSKPIGPSAQPSSQPSLQPSMQPSCYPSTEPSNKPSRQPSQMPSCLPSMQPSSLPSMLPYSRPSSHPSRQPSFQPSSFPSQPSSQPSRQPSRLPTRQPSSHPTSFPSNPSSQPTRQPSMHPSRQPTSQPSSCPSGPSSQPSSAPSSKYGVLEANSLCEFKKGISNWDEIYRNKNFTGWDCTNAEPSTALSIPCKMDPIWTGIVCEIDKFVVTSMNLSSYEFIGTISSSLGNLGGLEYLDISKNKLSSSIPSELSTLSKFKTLLLNDNRLTGPAGNFLCSSASSLPYFDLQLQDNSLSCISNCVAQITPNYDYSTPVGCSPNVNLTIGKPHVFSCIGGIQQVTMPSEAEFREYFNNVKVALYVFMWGAGGSASSGGIGGAGAYVEGMLTSVSAGQRLNIVVGQGGIAGLRYISGGGGGVQNAVSATSAAGGGRSAIQDAAYSDLVTAGGGGGAACLNCLGGAATSFANNQIQSVSYQGYYQGCVSNQATMTSAGCCSNLLVCSGGGGFTSQIHDEGAGGYGDCSYCEQCCNGIKYQGGNQTGSGSTIPSFAGGGGGYYGGGASSSAGGGGSSYLYNLSFHENSNSGSTSSDICNGVQSYHFNETACGNGGVSFAVSNNMTISNVNGQSGQVVILIVSSDVPSYYVLNPTDGSNGPCPFGSRYIAYNKPCVQCLTGYYKSGPTTCTLCSYPFTNYRDGMESCPNFKLLRYVDSTYSNTFAAVVISILLLITFLILQYSFRNLKLAATAFVLMFFPSVDVLTDVAYLITNLFYSLAIFILCAVFVMLSNVIFLKLLYDLKARPKQAMLVCPLLRIHPEVVWLSLRGFDVKIGDSFVMSPKLNSFYVVVINIIVFALLLPIQFVWLAFYCVWRLFDYLFIFSSVLLIGFFFFQTKLLAVKVVWNFWFTLWTGTNKFDKTASFDAAIFNEALIFEFLAETLPQLMLQTYNNVKIGNFSGIALFSNVLSVFIALNGIYEFGYYKFYLERSFGDIPLLIELNVDGAKGSKEIKRDRAKLAKSSKIDLSKPHIKLTFEQSADDDNAGGEDDDGGGTGIITGSGTSSSASEGLEDIYTWLVFTADLDVIDAFRILSVFNDSRVLTLKDLWELNDEGKLLTLPLPAGIKPSYLSRISKAIFESDFKEKYVDIVSATKQREVILSFDRTVVPDFSIYKEDEFESASVNRSSSMSAGIELKSVEGGGLILNPLIDIAPTSSSLRMASKIESSSSDSLHEQDEIMHSNNCSSNNNHSSSDSPNGFNTGTITSASSSSHDDYDDDMQKYR